MDLTQLMNQAKQMQDEMENKEKELEKKVYTATAGGGALTIKIRGNFSVEEVTIEKELLEATNKEMIEELIQITMNDALNQIKSAKESNVNDLAANLNLKGLF